MILFMENAIIGFDFRDYRKEVYTSFFEVDNLFFYMLGQDSGIWFVLVRGDQFCMLYGIFLTIEGSDTRKV